MKRQRAEISSNVISHIKSAHPIEMWRSNKLGIKEKISRGNFPRLIFSCPVPSGLPHRSHCVPMNMNPWNYRVFTCQAASIRIFSPWKPCTATACKFPAKNTRNFFEVLLTLFEPSSEFNTSITRPAFGTHPAAVLASILPLSADR